MSQPKYYHPYTSDNDEKDSDSDSNSSNSSNSSDDSASQQLDDPRYAIIRASGPSFTTVNEQLLYQKKIADNIAPYIPQPQNTIGNSILYKNPKKRIHTTLFSFKSENRDKQIYPTSSDFTIKLPRPFKNVTQIQFVQISYQSFFNFIPDVSGFIDSVLPYLTQRGMDISECLCCLPVANTQNSIAISEVGRVDPLNPSKPFIKLITVRSSRYTNVSLSYEMDYQMNNTPPFNIMSYSEHRTRFRATNSLNHLFNEPGRYVYNYDTRSYILSRTKKIVIDQFYPYSIYTAGIPTENETFVAYYYPVFKQAMISKNDHPFLDLNGNSYASVYIRTIQNFEGISSSYYYDLCKLNLAYLIKYRELHTFKYNLIYQYDWEYDSGMRSYRIVHNALHPSIVADISLYRKESHLNAIHNNGIADIDTYNTQLDTLNQYKSIFTDLETIMNNALTKVGIEYSLIPSAIIGSKTSNIITKNTALMNPNDLIENDIVFNRILNKELIYDNSDRSIYRGAPIDTTTKKELFTFGRINFTDLTQQASDISCNDGTTYDPTYIIHLRNMNRSSVINSTLGTAYSTGYTGVYIKCNDFNELYLIYVYYYLQWATQSKIIDAIALDEQTMTDNYIYNKYGAIFPPSLFDKGIYLRNTGTGKVILNMGNTILRGSSPFQEGCDTNNKCCQLIQQVLLRWYSCLPANYVITTLPWKLGLTVTLDDVISFISTTSGDSITTPFNIFIQMNIERSMNNMAVGTNENYRITNDPVSESNVVLAKILTEGSGLSDTVQAIIQSPAQFFTPMGKLDKLHFTMLLDNLTPISKLFPFDLAFTEWDATIQIDEEIYTLDRDTDLSTVPTVDWAANDRKF